jgi:hypothetical protein
VPQALGRRGRLGSRWPALRCRRALLSAPYRGRHPSARLGDGRRFALGRDDKSSLKLTGETVHKARADNRMEL